MDEEEYNGAEYEEESYAGAMKDVGAFDEIEGERVEVPLDEFGTPPLFSFKKLWAFTGPGFLMSIAYLDPGNIESDLQAGATAGYQLLWVLLWSTVIGLILQLLAARLGVVTGKHLAELCRLRYSPVPRYLLWIMAELAIVGSDIQEVVGSALAIQILSLGYIPLWAGCLITALDTFSFLFLEKYGVRKLEAFFGFLVSVMAITFGVEFFLSDPDEWEVLKGTIVPYVSEENITQAVGIVGAVIMPHNIFLHSALVQTRKIDRQSEQQISEANKYYAVESAIALAVSFFINLFVVAVFAAGSLDDSTPEESWDGSDYPGCKDYDPNDPLGLQHAGCFLAMKFGTAAMYVWAVGLLAAGQSSTMTGTYAGQFVMQGFLNLQIAPWKRVLLTRSVAIVPAVLVAAFAGSALDTLDEGLNVLQSIQLPFALLPVLKFTSKDELMGVFVNKLWLKVLCWGLALMVLIINGFQVVDVVFFQLDQHWYITLIASVVSFFYLLFVLYLAIHDIPIVLSLVERVTKKRTGHYEHVGLN
eukprot:TRINITY_DN3872_c0_g1_i1.p1 TRINITY_DN3872_c0_g1~~TRINITY_DN3872_c0_g1_i1.p1  ORF type:complete len:530 (-),score=178.29 TRINITY_DN3872_c0_g1_i1:139-1728(-)